VTRGGDTTVPPVPLSEAAVTEPAVALPIPPARPALKDRQAPAEIDRIADRVYRLLVQRVRGERERRGF
jgi:hypothetical protein